MRVNNDLFRNSNDSYNSLENILMEAKAKHFQPHEVRYNKYKHKFSPLDNIWYNLFHKIQRLALPETKENRCSVARV